MEDKETVERARVTLQGVTKRFGPVRALSGIDVTFEAGRISVLTGPNGSGKSTLLAIAGTLTKPTTGSVEHHGLGRNRSEIRASLGWVGHDTLCYGELTGRENIELAARLQSVDPEPAFAFAETRFDLAAFASRPVRTYSRGQRQRVALARALVHKPRLLLLDEPTAGLDAFAAQRLTATLLEEKQRGVIVIVVTHDADLVKMVGDQRFVLERGRLQSS